MIVNRTLANRAPNAMPNERWPTHGCSAHSACGTGTTATIIRDERAVRTNAANQQRTRSRCTATRHHAQTKARSESRWKAGSKRHSLTSLGAYGYVIAMCTNDSRHPPSTVTQKGIDEARMIGFAAARRIRTAISSIVSAPRATTTRIAVRRPGETRNPGYSAQHIAHCSNRSRSEGDSKHSARTLSRPGTEALSRTGTREGTRGSSIPVRSAAAAVSARRSRLLTGARDADADGSGGRARLPVVRRHNEAAQSEAPKELEKAAHTRHTGRGTNQSNTKTAESRPCNSQPRRQKARARTCPRRRAARAAGSPAWCRTAAGPARQLCRAGRWPPGPWRARQTCLTECPVQSTTSVNARKQSGHGTQSARTQEREGERRSQERATHHCRQRFDAVAELRGLARVVVRACTQTTSKPGQNHRVSRSERRIGTTGADTGRSHAKQASRLRHAAGKSALQYQ